MNQEDFEKLVKIAIKKLPKNIRQALNNIAIVIEKKPSQNELKKIGTKIRGKLLGLYQGVPQTTWGRGWGMRLPDKITIFQESIENLASSPQEMEKLVEIVVWHEIAHHFGFDEKKVRQLEARWQNKTE